MKRVFYNNDNNCFFYRQLLYNLPVNEESLKEYINQYSGSNITDFSINTFGQVSMFKNDSTECENDMLKSISDELGYDFNDRNRKINYHLEWMKMLQDLWDKNIDHIKVWINELRKIGIRPWISIRTNDAHHLFHDSYYWPKFRKDHDGEYEIVRHRKPIDYLEKCFDYSIDTVRNRIINVVKENLDRYDVDGIEIDFMREMDSFQYGSEFFGREILNDFMRTIKKMVLQYETKYGHKIEIGVRVMTTPEYNQEMGFDIIEWAKEGLVDVVVPTPRYRMDNNPTYYFWKQIMEPYGVDVLSGFEIIIKVGNREWTNIPEDINTVETVFGSSASFLSQGVDGLYFFNYFDNLYDCSKYSVVDYKKCKNNSEDSLKTPYGFYRLWFEMKLDDSIYDLPRRNIYTFSDKAPMWRCSNPFQTTPSIDNGIPRELVGYDKNGVINPAFYRVITGKILKNSKVILYLGLTKPLSEIDGFTLFVNSKPVKYIGEKECVKPKLTNSKLYAFEIENDGNMPDVQILEIYIDSVKSGGMLDYIEISINKDF